MIKRLIDANALQNLLIPIAISLEYEYGSLGGAVSGVMKHIDNMPTIDAVPVVRCKDCVHGINSNGGIACTEFCNVIHKPDDFCSRGERKEDYD